MNTQMVIEALKQQLAETHDPTHEYQDNQICPGSCLKCGWFDPNGPKLDGLTLRERAEAMIQALEENSMEVAPTLLIEVTIIRYPGLPFGRHPWWNWGI